ncbi:MAG: F0F1 ATP synthase subunit epsilon [Armatimonadota bacterium]|nr:MAG: F0F1 ATP synthase subunit epsilon [Armatimonadota bacterium]
MPPTFRVDVITPDRTAFSGDVVGLVAPGSEGYLGVLANHAPLLTALGVGEARMTDGEGRDIHFAISGGFLEVADNRAILLADAAERADQIDVARAEAARERAEQTRGQRSPADPGYAAAEAALARAINRLRVAREHGRADEG